MAMAVAAQIPPTGYEFPGLVSPMVTCQRRSSIIEDPLQFDSICLIILATGCPAATIRPLGHW